MINAAMFCCFYDVIKSSTFKNNNNQWKVVSFPDSSIGKSGNETKCKLE